MHPRFALTLALLVLLPGGCATTAGDPAVTERPPAPETLSRAERGALLSDEGEAAAMAGELDRARELLMRAVTLAPDDVDAWWRLSWVEMRRGDHDASATAFARIALGWPDLVGNIEGAYIHQLAHLADPEGLPRLDLLQALFDAGWDDNGLGADNLWLDLATLRLERGEDALAAEAVARIQDPLMIVRMRMDRRFDALVDRDAPRFDVARAMARKVDRLFALSRLHPRWLEARNYLGFALLEAGRDATALADAEAILAIVAAAPADAPPFDDMDELNWTGDTRSNALRRLGRIDEAVAMMREASRATEGGAPNVSQALNLGSFYCALGRWEEAGAVVAPVDGMSGYGRMVQAAVQHCSALGVGDTAAADAALAYIRAHREDAPTILLESLLEAGHVDEAADAIIDMLASPTDRADALFFLQDFLETPDLPGEAGYQRHFEALRARDDVRRAAEAVGRIERHPIHA